MSTETKPKEHEQSDDPAGFKQTPRLEKFIEERKQR